MEIFVRSPNCLLPRGVCGFGLMPGSADADKEAHSWGDVGLFTEGAQAMAGGRQRL